MWAAVVAIAVVMVVTWAISLAIGNVSIVDIVWGLGFVAVAWSVRMVADGYEPRQNLLFLTRISGVTLLERSLSKRREGYDQYVATTSAFIPRRPRSAP